MKFLITENQIDILDKKNSFFKKLVEEKLNSLDYFLYGDDYFFYKGSTLYAVIGLETEGESTLAIWLNEEFVKHFKKSLVIPGLMWKFAFENKTLNLKVGDFEIDKSWSYIPNYWQTIFFNRLKTI